MVDTQNRYERTQNEYGEILQRQRRAMQDYHKGRNQGDLEHFCFMTHLHLCEALLKLKEDE